MGDSPRTVPGPTSGTGSVVSQQPITPIVAFPLLDSRSACAEALRAYLRCLVFTIDGLQAENTTFQLLDVNRQWPEPDKPMTLAGPGGVRRGVCTVLDPVGGQQAAWGLVPAALEDTIDRYAPNTVLWKTSELLVDLQADFWFANDAERQAVAAALPAAFSPSEDEFGVRLEAPPGYFSIAIRFSMIDAPRRADDPGSVYPRERRLAVAFRAEVSEVHLRRAVMIDIRVRQRVIDPNDPPVEPSEDPPPACP